MENTEKTTIRQGFAPAVKKLLSLLLALAMLFTITAGTDLSAYAATSGDYEYEILDDGTVEITRYNGSNSIVSIPSTIDGKKVTSIGNSAFEDCEDLISVAIPNGVTTINDYAFFGCYNLASIDIPDSVISIGQQAISYCHSLKFITIPNSVTTINDYAFVGCDNLMSIDIPSSVTSIGYAVFSKCPSLEIITVDKNNKIYDSRNNCNAIIESEYDDLIAGCKTTKIPNTVDSIGYQAFGDSENLTSIVIPNSVTSIGSCAFERCTNLTNITIPNSVTSIGGCAFAGCTNLRDITIPDSVTTIGPEAFEYTGYYDNESNWQNEVLYIGNHLIKAEDTISGSYTVKKGTVNIADEAFKDCKKLTSVTMSSGIIDIGIEAFMDCISLMSVTIPNSVINISFSAFMNCENLAHVTIPNSITTIGYYAFYNCKNLTNVTISTGVKYIWSYAFADCTNLKGIVIPNSVATIYNNTFLGCTNLNNITISNGVNTIEYYAFENCTSLTNITIPNSVEYIDIEAFAGCTNLESIKILNKNCLIVYGEDIIPKSTTIYGYKGSTAESYAKKHGNKFVALAEECTHTWNSGKVTKSATCIENGVKIYTCTVCGETKETTIAATGHKAVTDKAVSATCTKAGKTAGSHCSVCGAVIKAQKTVSATGHSYDAGKVTKAPTVTATGVKTYTCTKCGAKKTETIKATGLKKPTLKATVNANGSFKLSWNKVSGAEKYELYIKQSDGSYKLMKTTTGTSFTTGTAVYGKQYTYKMRAVKGKTKSAYSSAVNAKNTKKLQTPTLKVTVNSNGSFKLSWNKITGATSYKLYIKQPNGSYKLMKTTTGTSFTTGTAVYGKQYTYKVRAFTSKNSSATSAYSSAVNAKNTKKLQTPKLKATVNKNGSFKLSWGKVTGATSYQIYMKQANGKYKLIKKTTATSFKTGVAKKGKTYSYKIRAVTSKNSKAASNYSNVVNAKRK